MSALINKWARWEGEDLEGLDFEAVGVVRVQGEPLLAIATIRDGALISLDVKEPVAGALKDSVLRIAAALTEDEVQ